MPDTDISALLDSLRQAGKPPGNGTSEAATDDHDDAINDQRERLELRQKAAEVGLVVHAATDPEMLRSLITRKAFIDQHAKDTMKPAEIEKQQEAFDSLQSYGSGIIEGTLSYLKPRGSVEQVKKTARGTFEDHALKSSLKKGSDELELAHAVFEAALDAVTEKLHDKADGVE